MKPVTCPFAHNGCKIQLVHRDLEEHLSSYSAHHLDLITKSLESFKVRAESAEQQLRIARAEAEDLKEQVMSERISIRRKMQAIAQNAQELLDSCAENQKFGVQSIVALTMEGHVIETINMPLTFQMVNYSEFRRSGKVWYSAPFYVAGGYKMCLAAYANGQGSGQGSHLSASLCLMKGEFDDELAWPVELPFHLVVEIVKQGDEFENESAGSESPQNPRTYIYFHSGTPQEKVVDDTVVEARKCENFAQHDLVENWLLYYDALTFRIMAESEFL